VEGGGWGGQPSGLLRFTRKAVRVPVLRRLLRLRNISYASATTPPQHIIIIGMWLLLRCSARTQRFGCCGAVAALLRFSVCLRLLRAAAALHVGWALRMEAMGTRVAAQVPAGGAGSARHGAVRGEDRRNGTLAPVRCTEQ
jgi:hypothetical protein